MCPRIRTRSVAVMAVASRVFTSLADQLRGERITGVSDKIRRRSAGKGLLWSQTNPRLSG